MDKIEVTDADREAAAAVLHDNLGWYRAAPVRAGEMDNDSVVQAFARHRTTRTDAKPVAWMPMTSSPADEPILAAIKVNHKNGTTWWERHIIVIDSETGTISDMDFHHGWEAEDYEFWQPLPSAPDATYTHPPATDVAALVEAAKETNAALERDGDPAFAHLILDNKAALAPFTKGQNDE